jgi:hypothetical protein
MFKISSSSTVQVPFTQFIGIAVATGLGMLSRREGRAIVGCSLLLLGLAVLAANKR